jgi:hypothetical protein
MDPSPPAGLLHRVNAFGEQVMQLRSEMLGPLPSRGVLREQRHGEKRQVHASNHKDAASRTPHLDQARFLQAPRRDALDPGMDGQQRRTRHAVLNADPRRSPEVVGASGQAPIEWSDRSSVPQNLLGAVPLE